MSFYVEVSIALNRRCRAHQPESHIRPALGTQWKPAAARDGYFVIEPVPIVLDLIHPRFRNRIGWLKDLISHVASWPEFQFRGEQNADTSPARARVRGVVLLPDAMLLREVAQRSEVQLQIRLREAELRRQLLDLLFQLHQRQAHLLHLLIA